MLENGLRCKNNYLITRGLYQVYKASRLGTVFNLGEVMVREKNGLRYIIILFGLKVLASFLILSRGRLEALAYNQSPPSIPGLPPVSTII